MYPSTEISVKTMPETLRWLRRDMRHLKLREVSDLTGLSISFLSDIECGRTVPSIATLQKLAHCYQAPLVLRLSPGEVTR